MILLPCTLPHTSSIPMGAVNFYMQEHFLHSLMTFIPIFVMYLPARMFCTLACVSYIPMDAINFYMQEHFLHSVIRLLYPCLRCIYLQECSVHSPLRLLFPWVQCQSLKPVLSKCSKTGFVTVDDFIAVYTHSYISYSYGAINFYMQEHFLHSLLIQSHNFYRAHKF